MGNTNRRRVAPFLACLAAATLTAAAAPPAHAQHPATSASPPPGSRQLSPGDLGLDPEEWPGIEVRVEERADGTRHGVLGQDVDNVPFTADTVRYAAISDGRSVGEATSSQAKARAGAPAPGDDVSIQAGTCYWGTNSPWFDNGGATLVGDYQVSCDSLVDTYRTDDQFHRSSWRSWEGYNTVFPHNYRLAPSTYTGQIRAVCNTGAGTFDYVTAFKPYHTDVYGSSYVSGWVRSSSTRANCGPSA